MFIIGIDTATPPQRYSQADCWKAPQEAAPFLKLNRRSKAILKKVLTGENGIATRHFALEQLHRAFDLTPDALHARFAESAPAIATLAAERALAHAQTEPREVDAFLISACLFGDGAGAAVLSPSANGGRRVKLKSGSSLMKPDDRDLLRFEQKGGMLRNILTPQVPALVAQHCESVFAGTLAHSNVAQSQISGWILHPGGRDVLLALRERFQLSDHDVRWSRSVLHEYGNMSSPSVWFVLQAALADSVPGSLWWMSSFGAGFSCHGALLEVE
jgi:predicted naringenin-chalcone synthase